jgi:hypothetical protein
VADSTVAAEVEVVEVEVVAGAVDRRFREI